MCRIPRGPGGDFHNRATDVASLRATASRGRSRVHKQIVSLMQRFSEAGLDVIKTENLYNFDRVKGYSA